MDPASNKHTGGIHHDLRGYWRCQGQARLLHPQLGRWREHLVLSSADTAWTGSWLVCPTLPWPQFRWASLPQIWSANCVSFLRLNAVGLWTTILTSANWSFFRDFQMFQPFSRPELVIKVTLEASVGIWAYHSEQPFLLDLDKMTK